MLKKNLFNINNFFLFINILLINSIFSRDISFSRDDTDPDKVAPEMLELIDENFKGKNGDNYITRQTCTATTCSYTVNKTGVYSGVYAVYGEGRIIWGNKLNRL